MFVRDTLTDLILSAVGTEELNRVLEQQVARGVKCAFVSKKHP